MKNNPHIIITGGGTGGHIFPAISIANGLKREFPDAKILFVGAKGGMEMKVVPQNGYDIQGVWISGIQRQLNLRNIRRNISFPFKLIASLRQSGKIIKTFQPHIVIGVGGYASGPMGRVAARKGIPLVICEQNAFPGMVNRWLAKFADKILLGNEAAAKYFPKSKSKITGNPVRQQLLQGNRERGLKTWGLDPDKPVLLSLGGSLGAAPINNALRQNLHKLAEADIQLLWQCGKRYYSQLKAEAKPFPNVRLLPFIEKMEDAYAVAGLVISRAGGSTISELILLNKPSILLPSPNVSEDHQTKNAKSLVDKNAAILVEDKDAATGLVPKAIEIIKDGKQLEQLQEGISAVEKHDAVKEIVNEIVFLMK